MNDQLEGKTVAILTEDGFEQVELTEPRKALKKAGGERNRIAEEIRSKDGNRPSGAQPFWWMCRWKRPTRTISMLCCCRGRDESRSAAPQEQALNFIRAFFAAGKPVAAICHGPQSLIDAEVVRGRRLTSFESIQTDLRNAGAEWVDEPVVVDNGLVTSRKPDDLPAFNAKMIEEFAEGRHSNQAPETRVEPVMAGG
jgi:protease I